MSQPIRANLGGVPEPEYGEALCDCTDAEKVDLLNAYRSGHDILIMSVAAAAGVDVDEFFAFLVEAGEVEAVVCH